jgi:RIO-like serine/threonine protein kinase
MDKKPRAETPPRKEAPRGQDLSLTPRELLQTPDTLTVDGDGAQDEALQTSLTQTPSSGIPKMLRDWSRYEVLQLLGAGGMGVVYKARDKRLRRFVALKIIHPRLGQPGVSAIEVLERRFLREARLQAALDHPHICKVYEVGRLPSSDEEPGYPYIAMQLIAGEPLHRAQAEMSTLDKITIVHTVAEALHCAHRQGLIHRDIKPQRSSSRNWRRRGQGEFLKPKL